MSGNEVALVSHEENQVLKTLRYLARHYQSPKHDNLFREVRKGSWPNITEQFPRLLLSMHGVIQAYGDIGGITVSSAGPQCSSDFGLAHMNRDTSRLLTLFLGGFEHCTHKPPREVLGYFSDVNGVPSQFSLRAITVQVNREMELAVMLIGDHPDVLNDLANPDFRLDQRTIAQSFSQLIVHPNGELTSHYYRPMDMALPSETFLRELQGAPLVPPRHRLYTAEMVREKLNPSMFLNPRSTMPRLPMKPDDFKGLFDLLCKYLDEVADCLANHL